VAKKIICIFASIICIFTSNIFQLNRIFLLLFGLVTIVAHAQVPDYVPTEGLVGWYPLDGNALDYSALFNNGSVHGATPTQDRYGNENGALNFDVNDWSWGSGGNWVYIPFQEAFNTSEVTVCAWVKRNSGGLTWDAQGQAIAHRYQFGYNNPNGETWVMGMGNASSAQGCIAYAAIIQQSPSPAVSVSTQSPDETPLATWFHVTMTWDGEELRYYQNGSIVAILVDPSFVINQVGNSGISLGMSTQANGHWSPLDGDLDDFGLWNRALTECEIAALYAAESNTTVSVSAGADLSICSGDSIVLSASGGDSTYTWSNGIEDGVAFVPDSSSYFTVEGSLGACTSTDTIFVEVLQPTAGMDTQVVCDSLTWLDGITYTASTNEPFIALTNAAGCDSLVTLDLTVNYTTYNTIDTTVVNVLEYNGEEYTEGGEFLVYLENEAGCDSIVTIKLTVEYVGVDDLETPGAWSVYPNPIESQLTISSANALEFHLVQIFNALGQVIWSERVSAQVTIEVDAWPRGMYVVDIQGEAVEARERMQIVLK